jgi:hypothetical protein
MLSPSFAPELTHSPAVYASNSSTQSLASEAGSPTYGESDIDASDALPSRPSRVGNKTPGLPQENDARAQCPPLRRQQSYVRTRYGDFTDYTCTEKCDEVAPVDSAADYSYANCQIRRPQALPICASRTSVRASLARDQSLMACSRETARTDDGMALKRCRSDPYDCDGRWAVSTLVKHLEDGADAVTEAQAARDETSDDSLTDTTHMRSIAHEA